MKNMSLRHKLYLLAISAQAVIALAGSLSILSVLPSEGLWAGALSPGATLILFLVECALCLAVALFGVRALTEPLEALSAVSQAVAPPAPRPARREPELAVLSARLEAQSALIQKQKAALNELCAALDFVADGNRPPRLPYLGGERAARAARSLDRLSASLKSSRDCASQVHACSKQVADGAQSLSLSAAARLEASKELSAGLRGLSQKLLESVSIARMAMTQSGGTVREASQANRQLGQALPRIDSAAQTLGEAKNQMERLEGFARQLSALSLSASVGSANLGDQALSAAALEMKRIALAAAESVKQASSLLERSFGAVRAAQGAGAARLSLKKAVETSGGAAQALDDLTALLKEQSASLTKLSDCALKLAANERAGSVMASQFLFAAELLKRRAKELPGISMTRPLPVPPSKSGRVDLGSSFLDYTIVPDDEK